VRNVVVSFRRPSTTPVRPSGNRPSPGTALVHEVLRTCSVQGLVRAVGRERTKLMARRGGAALWLLGHRCSSGNGRCGARNNVAPGHGRAHRHVGRVAVERGVHKAGIARQRMHRLRTERGTGVWRGKVGRWKAHKRAQLAYLERRVHLVQAIPQHCNRAANALHQHSLLPLVRICAQGPRAPRPSRWGQKKPGPERRDGCCRQARAARGEGKPGGRGGVGGEGEQRTFHAVWWGTQATHSHSHSQDPL
jgi:hypothetical protein